MTTKKTRATSRQVDGLLHDVRDLPAEPVGAHLQDDEFDEYAAETLGPDDVARIDAHLESCAECVERMEHLLTVSEAWGGASGDARLSALSHRILEARKSREWLMDTLREWAAAWRFPIAPAVALADDSSLREGESPDGALSWRFDETPEGLALTVSSFHMELAGVRIQIECGQLREPGTLEPKAEVPGQVSARILIPSADRAALSGLEVRLSILPPDGEGLAGE